MCFIKFLTFSQSSDNGTKAQEAYTWKNVQIVGGGFVDGIIFHPTEKGLRYCRTDMGGAYKWNDSIKRWEPLLDWISYEDLNLMGVESIALDPSDPNMLYIACGTYTLPDIPDGAILRSDNRGKTFQRINVPFKMGGNENGRGNGERMAVDPNNGNIIYLGTRHAGLWRSLDKGVSWEKVAGFPDVTEELDKADRYAWWNQGSGIIFVVYDKKSKTQKGSSKIYAGVSIIGRDNLFYSDNGGENWIPVPNQPKQYRPTHGILADDGNFYITYGTNPGPGWMKDGAVWKYNINDKSWKDITPEKPKELNVKFGYAAVSVDASNPDVIIVSSYSRPDSLGGDEIFRSLNGGKSWKQVFATGKEFDYSLAPYVHHTPIHWMFDIEIDPFNSDHVMFTTGYGGHESYNFTNTDKGMPVKWTMSSTGVEETVALELLSPPKGGQLVSAIGDYCGFVHHNLDKPVEEGCFDNPHFGNTNGIACAELNPSVLVRVGVASHHKPGKNIGYSKDAGKTWQPTNSVPEQKSRLGHIAVSADGNSWIWSPDKNPVYYTHDFGNTWFKVKGLDSNTRVVADKMNPAKFYAINLKKEKYYISKNSGASFEEYPLNIPSILPLKPGNRGDDRGGQDRIYTTPGYEGELWIAAFDGLFNSTDAGNTFNSLPNISEIHAFGFGKEKPGEKYPALYLIGVISGQRGIFRSADKAKTWVRINDDQHQWGLVLHITGDPKKYGRVYVGTHGRGIFYGDPK